MDPRLRGDDIGGKQNVIGKLKGVVDSYGEDFVILDVHGVGYVVHCSSRTLQNLPPTGEAATLSIETHVREDMIRLFGFRSDSEREWFRLLQSVQGVGSKVALGILSAIYKGRWVDYLSMTVALAGVSVPVFWLGLLLILAFGSILPIGGNLSPEHDVVARTGFLLIDTLLMGRADLFADAVLHLLMPALALSTIPLAMTARITRSSLLEVLGSDYIRTARAKGASPGRIVLRHALRNAALPIVTLMGLEFGYLLGGAVLTETVFDWDGMGTYILTSVRETEYESIGGAVLVLAGTFVMVNLVVDILYAFIDTRVRYGSQEA